METLPKKKVLFLITKSNWGGAQRYVYDLATNLPRHFSVVVAHGGNGVLIEKLQAANIKTIAIKSLQRDISFTQEVASLREIYQLLKREAPDVLHINSSKAGLYGSALGRITSIPRIIFTTHGWAFNADHHYWQRLLFKVGHYSTVIFAHRTIAVSSGLKAELAWPGIQSKMTVINPRRQAIAFLSRHAARQNLITALPALAAHGSETWIGTIAELHPVKQLPTAITALASVLHRYPNLRYVIIGSGEQADTLHALIASLHLQQHVFLAGHLTEAATHLKAFDTFLLSSKSESFGYVLVEALQARLPIIATQVGGIPDIITHNVNGLLVPAGDSFALGNALIELLGNTELQARLEASPHHHPPADFYKMIEATVALYENN